MENGEADDDGEEQEVEDILGLEEDDEPQVDPRMAEVLAAAESGDLATLCSLFETIEVRTAASAAAPSIAAPQ